MRAFTMTLAVSGTILGMIHEVVVF